jgi:hypothetical protein
MRHPPATEWCHNDIAQNTKAGGTRKVGTSAAGECVTVAVFLILRTVHPPGS